MNTAAKIIAAPLPSILDIFLARCSIAKQIVSWRTPPIPPTVSSSSYHQEDGTGASEPAPPDCSTAFSPRLWEPWTQLTPPLSETPYKPPTSWNMDHHPPTTSNLPHQRKNSDTFLCSSKCASHKWVGLHKPPVVTHSPLFALDTFHTLLCVHNPTKRLNSICMFTCSCTSHPLTLFSSQLFDLPMFLSAHVQYSFEAFVQFV